MAKTAFVCDGGYFRYFQNVLKTCTLCSGRSRALGIALQVTLQVVRMYYTALVLQVIVFNIMFCWN